MSTNGSQRLRECPFCGGEAQVQHQSRELYGDVVDWYGVYCKKQFCGYVSGQSTEAEAIAAWNTRATVEYEGWFYLPKPKRCFVQYGTPQIEKTENGYRAKQHIEVIESVIRTWGDELGEYVMKRICEVFGSELGSGTCENVSDPPEGFLCSACGWGDFAEPSHLLTTAKYAGRVEGGPNFCPNCGKAVKR